MNVRDTSLISYAQLRESLGDRQKVVLILIRKNPDCTDRELTNLLGSFDSNFVRPRRNELVKLGLIEESGKKKCSMSGRLAITWREVLE